MTGRAVIAGAVGVLALALIALATSARKESTPDDLAAVRPRPACTVTVTPGPRAIERSIGDTRAGDVVCLEAGASFIEDVTIRRGGDSREPLVLTSAPGPPARLHGRLVVIRPASDVVIRDLVLDGRNAQQLPSPSIAADRVTLLMNDISNANTGICVIVGSVARGPASGTVILGNRIHHCGRVPGTNRDHGIYVESSRDAFIAGNVIADNADRGVQLYPDAQGTLVERNVIDANGVGIIISGADGRASSANVVRNNIITNSRDRHDVESFWPAGNPVGSRNVVTANCIGGGRSGPLGAALGFRAVDNRIVRLAFRDPQRLELAGGSPCDAYLPPRPIGPG
jgi:parallel beta-helix repeat protein